MGSKQRAHRFLIRFFSAATAVLTLSCLANANPIPANTPVEDAFQQGVDLFLDEQYDEAQDVFRQCAERDPKNAEYLCWQAQAKAFGLGERAKRGASVFSLISDGRAVRDLYEKAIEIDPGNERARIGHAVILRDIPGWLGGDLAEAEELLRSVVRDNPNNFYAYHHLGTLYIRKKEKPEEGLDYLQQALQTADGQTLTAEEKLKLAGTYHALGKTYLEELREPVKALPYLEKSRALQPDNVVMLLDLAEAYRAFNMTAKAKDTLRGANDIIKSRDYSHFRDDLVKAAKKLDMRKELGL